MNNKPDEKRQKVQHVEPGVGIVADVDDILTEATTELLPMEDEQERLDR